MRAKKTLTHVSANENIQHTGDLIIEGDVGEHAIIDVKEGSLIIKGDIKKGAQVKHSIPKHLVQTNAITTITNLFNSGHVYLVQLEA